MYSLDKDKFIDKALKIIVKKIVEFFRCKLKKNDYNEELIDLENKINKLSKEKIKKWKNEKQQENK